MYFNYKIFFISFLFFFYFLGANIMLQKINAIPLDVLKYFLQTFILYRFLYKAFDLVLKHTWCMNTESFLKSKNITAHQFLSRNSLQIKFVFSEPVTHRDIFPFLTNRYNGFLKRKIQKLFK